MLWSHRTTLRTSTGETPFKMANRTEAVLPVEISINSLRVKHFDPKASEEGLRLNCDLLEKLLDSTKFKVAKYQEKVVKYYNSKVKTREFTLNDLVLRDSAASMPPRLSKLSPPWEGPYKITKVVKSGTYLLAYLDGSPVPNAWNAAHLKKFYP